MTKPLTKRKGKVPATALSFVKGLGRIPQGGEAPVRCGGVGRGWVKERAKGVGERCTLPHCKASLRGDQAVTYGTRSEGGWVR